MKNAIKEKRKERLSKIDKIFIIVIFIITLIYMIIYDLVSTSEKYRINKDYYINSKNIKEYNYSFKKIINNVRIEQKEKYLFNISLKYLKNRFINKNSNNIKNEDNFYYTLDGLMFDEVIEIAKIHAEKENANKVDMTSKTDFYKSIYSMAIIGNYKYLKKYFEEISYKKIKKINISRKEIKELKEELNKTIDKENQL